MSKIISFFKRKKVTLLIIFLIASLFYILFSDINKNNLNASLIEHDKIDPYILVTDWNIVIKRGKVVKLLKWQKEAIQIKDKIRTWSKSAATIFWSDWNITRLWEKTSLIITELRKSKDLSWYEVKFNLESWKTWSNIVRYLEGDSSFTETYDNERLAATVRWTVFELNLDNNYIHAVNHSVTIKDNQTDKKYDLPEWKLRASSGDSHFIWKDVLEEWWVNWNKNEDVIYARKLLQEWKDKINKTFKDGDNLKKSLNDLIDWKNYNLSEIKENIEKDFQINNKEQLNRFYINLYQNINYAPASDNNTQLKANLRNEIINSSTWSSKERFTKDFLRLNLYDYFDSEKLNLSDSKEKLKSYIDLYSKNNLDKQYLKDLFSSFDDEKINQINEKFDFINLKLRDFLDAIKNPDLDKEIVNWSYEKIKEINTDVYWKIDETKDELKKGFSNFLNWNNE
ncbi:MAG: hypothetical protein ACD_4C00343G0001 [uncultured bacterium (gcode 4)]|uniref:Uncharacterized protein n=1 Tax=uncultured bacterium (gcode 4) TaxID=1234023 RepID=K2F5B6_9BACT|nr:MAG: hypothetical protein ACD_4C00343G0001 [uncultured bacterium (gcode 4)]